MADKKYIYVLILGNYEHYLEKDVIKLRTLRSDNAELPRSVLNPMTSVL